MKYLLLIYVDPAQSPSDEVEGRKLTEEYMAFTQEIIDSGELRGGDALEAIETATSVRVRNGRTTTTDGPFAETKEHLGGYYLVDTRDLDRALELAARIPGARHGTVEVRPVRDMPQD